VDVAPIWDIQAHTVGQRRVEELMNLEQNLSLLL